MIVRLNSKMIAGLTAAALATAVMAMTPAQAESRVYPQGTKGPTEYTGNQTSLLNQVLRLFSKPARADSYDSRQNFATGDRNRPQRRIHR